MPGKMYSAKEIAKIYGVTPKTAREYMKQMGCEKRPYRVSDIDLARWKKRRYSAPVNYQKALDDYQAAREKVIMRFQMKGVRK
jgi:hypothetical protein